MNGCRLNGTQEAGLSSRHIMLGPLALFALSGLNKMLQYLPAVDNILHIRYNTLNYLDFTKRPRHPRDQYLEKVLNIIQMRSAA